MGSTGKPGFVYMQGEGGGAGGGGGGTGGGGTGGGEPFADAAAARTFLKDYVPAEDYLTGFDDTKVLPFAKHVHGKVQEYQSQIPATWRKIVAGDNAEHMKTLERFASPKALYESYAALRGKMASGELKAVTAFPEKGTPEEQTAWRTANGLPDKPEGYELKLPQGVVLGEEDKTVVEGFRKHAFASNMPPAAFNAAMSYYAADKERVATERAAKDAEFQAASEDALRAEWGQGYRENIGRIGMMLSAAPEGVKGLVEGARLADGTPLGNHPGVLKWLAELSRQVNPSGVQIPADGTLTQSVEAEIKTIEDKMRTDRVAYNKDEKMQERYRVLLSAYEKHNGRAWGSKAA